MYKRISDYGIIGNLYTVALVGIDGSIDWLCLPHIDSPSVFAALLDDRKGGRFSIRPAGEYDSATEYVPQTNILVTRFRTRIGEMKLTDFMPVYPEGAETDAKQERRELYRLVEVTSGNVIVEVVFEPKFDYARKETALEVIDNGIVASGGNERVTLSSSRPLGVTEGTGVAHWHLSEGDRVWLHMQYGTGVVCTCDVEDAERSLRQTEKVWRRWLLTSETGRTIDFGEYKPMVERSALVLKLLYYQPTGAIAAAATTSLPEEIGGVRNWDYRYTWIRDTSFTLQALFALGHLSETEGYIRWLNRLLTERTVGELQVMYGLRGEEELPEKELSHLEGYKGSQPVRIGNAASRQKQLDIYGELMDAALKLSDYVGKIDAATWPLLRGICDHVVGHWHGSDSGIWEMRGGPRHFVYSKVMCWVALDRGITIADRYGFPADTEGWKRTREEIKSEVLRKGWSEEKQAFVQHYDADDLDAGNLLMPALGFIEQDDPRMVSTIEATVRELGHDGFLYRYSGEDGLRGGEGTFLLCTFWLVDNLIGLGRLDEAEAYLRRLEGVANRLGLFSEEYDPVWNEALGNFPQAFTHIGYVNSVTALCRARARESEEAVEEPSLAISLANEIILNEGISTRSSFSPSALAVELKNAMNILRGAYFDTPRGRVAYERMKKSEAYREYVALSNALKHMNPAFLKDRNEQIAFWINLYNVIVIHGVVEMGIRDSVKEVRNFFRRVQYDIGGMLFCPEDIEHGILRGNRRPPGAMLRMFRGDDRRLDLVISPFDPRVHFTLVCASSSCPPIAVYTAENLDRELDLAGETFLNAGGISIDRENGSVTLSRIFKWYRKDFGETRAERLRCIARFLHDENDREYLMKNAESLSVHYQDYDWRLNRS